MKKFTLSVVTVLSMSAFALAGGDIAPVEPEVVVPAPAPVVEDDSGFYLGVAYSRANFREKFNGYNDHYDAATGDLPADANSTRMWSGKEKIDYDGIMAQAGYKFNKYIALEGRYWWSLGDSPWTRTVTRSGTYNNGLNSWGPYTHDSGGENGDDLKAWGVYAKPMYPVTEQLDIYALLGYGNVRLSDDYGKWLDENDFQWGLGASYKITDNVSIFLDYVNLLNKDGSRTWDTVVNTGTIAPSYNGNMGEHNWNDKVYTVNIGLTYRF